jgi:hypothetical protein
MLDLEDFPPIMTTRLKKRVTRFTSLMVVIGLLLRPDMTIGPNISVNDFCLYYILNIKWNYIFTVTGNFGYSPYRPGAPASAAARRDFASLSHSSATHTTSSTKSASLQLSWKTSRICASVFWYCNRICASAL